MNNKQLKYLEFNIDGWGFMFLAFFMLKFSFIGVLIGWYLFSIISLILMFVSYSISIYCTIKQSKLKKELKLR